MRRLTVVMCRMAVVAMMVTVGVARSHATAVTVNYDAKTVDALTDVLQESLDLENEILAQLRTSMSAYTAAEVATAGLYAARRAEYYAYRDIGVFGRRNDNWYFRRICSIVGNGIMPKIWSVACLLVKRPGGAMYWGPYLFKTTEEVRQLCYEFESAVTNGNCTFKDVLVFYVISDIFRGLFDFSKLGGIDWEQVFTSFSMPDGELSREALEEDFLNFAGSGNNIAAAGLDSMFVKNSHVGQLLGGKAAGITSMLTQYGPLFDELADNGFADTVESLLGGKDSTAVARLLTLGEYNPDEYMNGARDSSGSGKTYYRQTWTIRREGWEYAKEILEEQTLSHPYYIDKQSSSCRYYTFMPGYQCFVDITDFEWNMLYYVQRNSSMKWTKAKVDAENRNQSEWVYHWDYTVTYTFNRTEWVSGREYEAWKATFAIVVWRERQARPGGDVYEEIYDSKTMDLDEFRQKMNEKLAEYLATGDGYELIEGEKIPYTEVSRSEVRSASCCSFNRKCDETTDLGSGHINWKENGDQGEKLTYDPSCIVYAMRTTLPHDDSNNLASGQRAIDSLRTVIRAKNTEIEAINNRINQLSILISNASQEEIGQYRAEWNRLKDELRRKEAERDELQAQLTEAENLLAESRAEDSEAQDDFYRVPKLMADLQSSYNIEWKEPGSWKDNGDNTWTFTRKGHAYDLNIDLTFKAKLYKTRDESHNWLIGRYHRAILDIDWSLLAEYQSDEVVEIMYFDKETDEEKEKMINDKLSELRENTPECTFYTTITESMSRDTTDILPVPHLMFMGDRIDMARRIEARLMKIYSILVLTEKYLRMSEEASLFDFLKGHLMRKVNPFSYAAEARQRWRDNAYAVATGAYGSRKRMKKLTAK